MHIAILGATSQIAKDLIVSFCADEDFQLYLFARQPDDVKAWLGSRGMEGRYPIYPFSEFGNRSFDTLINFVGAGDPAKVAALGRAILTITSQFDDMVLSYLQKYPLCRYLFLSSGAAYGSYFSEPVTADTIARVPINHFSPQSWYGVAKLYAECQHRSHSDLSIIDLRVFSYFSVTQDLSARFLLAEVLRCIRDGTVLETAPDYIVRDYLHPADFYQLITSLLCVPPTNTVLDCYTRSPIDKPVMLSSLKDHFGLQYEVVKPSASLKVTGNKPHYYSLNRQAAVFGYKPSYSSLEGVLQVAGEILGKNSV